MIKKYNEYLNDNFWKWFGDSKIVDENGKPKIMYHATKKDFNEFKLSYRKAIWVSESSKMTHSFIGGSKDFRENSSIMPLYVRCENPFDYRNKDMIIEFKKKLAEYRFNNKKENDNRTIYDFIDSVETYNQDIEEGNWKMFEYEMDVITFNKLGYDGVIMNELNQITMAVFDPNQLKSAIGNNGNFSLYNNSILENKLNEYRQQLEIPFDGKHPLHDKPTHVHVVDALKELDKKINIDNYKSNWTIKDIENAWYSNIEEAYERYKGHISSDDTEINYYFLGQYNPIDDSEYFNDEISNYIEENDIDDDRKVIDEFSLYDNLQDYLSPVGMDILDGEITRSLFDDKIDEYNVLYSLQNNLTDDGLVPIYRAISYEKNNMDDVYVNIMNYKNVGIYWSFEYRGAEPHGGGGGQTLVLCAYVKPEYINWVSTIYKSAWNLNTEKEIELENDVDVLIYNIDEYRTGKSIKLEKKLIVKT
jgi:hypothetical protein